MDQYCVVVCGLRADALDEASAWAPVAAALRMDETEFARRVVDALPRIVRQQLDRSTAERIAQLLQGMHVDARALPDDAQLVYLERAGSSRGPLPQSALGDFILSGETYRAHGSVEWLPWPPPAEPEASSEGTDVFDELSPPPVDEAFVDDVAVPAETDLTEPELPASPFGSAPPPLPSATAATAADQTAWNEEPDDAEPVWADEPIDLPQDELPAVGEAGHGVGDPHEADAEAMEADAFDPLDPDLVGEEPTDPDQPTADGDAAPARRSRFGRVLAMLVIVALAAWAYHSWTADTRVDDTPPPAAVGHAIPLAGAASTHPVAAASAPAFTASAPARGSSAGPVPASSAAALPTAASSAPPASGASAAFVMPSAAGTSAAPPAASSAAHAGSVPAPSASAAPSSPAGSSSAAPSH